MVKVSDIASGNHFVMLELSRRAGAKDPSNLNTIETNRIALLCDSVSVSTTKSAFPMEIPFSGVVAGESSTMVMDLGAARKDITITGRIVDQTITKFKGGENESPKRRHMTSYEIAQLLHSYVDSSFLHEDQNLSKLIILMPSLLDNNYEYRLKDGEDTGGLNHGPYDATDNPQGQDTPLEELPLIPFHFANRSYDVPNWSWGHTKKTFDEMASVASEIEGIRGMVSTFSCDFVGTETPTITFNLSFVQSATVVSDFINASF